MKKYKLLFTGGGGAASEAYARLFDDKYDVHFCDADINAKPFYIKKEKWHEVPLAKEPNFLSAILNLCDNIEIDIIIPSVDEELLSLSKIAQDKQPNVLLPTSDFITTHLDKFISNQFMHSNNLPAPITVLCSESKLIAFPCIIKPRSGRGSRNVKIVKTEEELKAHILLSKLPPEKFIMQELLEGQEFTVMMASDKDGQLVSVVPVLVKVKKGITLYAHTFYDSKVISSCEAIHNANPIPGCYNIQLIKTESGEVKPFEINPRISTTTCLGVAAGVDFVAIFLGLLKLKNNKLVDFNNQVFLRRSWYNEFIYSN